MTATRTCREYMANYADDRVNCATCVKYDRSEQRCREEAGVVQRYEDSSTFTAFDTMMKSNTPVYIT